MKGGAWYENTIFIVWGLSGLEADADEVSDQEEMCYPETWFRSLLYNATSTELKLEKMPLTMQSLAMQSL